MLGSEVLDVAIGVVFVFLLVSLIASAIREGLEGWLKTRATHLEAGIKELLQDKDGKGLVKQLFDHPLIYSLYPGDYSPRKKVRWLALTSGKNLPSYIPSRSFALALMDLAARGPIGDVNTPPSSAPFTLQTMRANVGQIGNVRVQRALLAAIDTSEGDLQKAQANIEAWYNSAMDRVSGWYKRSTQWFLFFIGLSVAIVMNINAIAIGNYLVRNRAARETLVAHAQAASSKPNFTTSDYSDIKSELQSFTLPIGWDYDIVERQQSPLQKSPPNTSKGPPNISQSSDASPQSKQEDQSQSNPTSTAETPYEAFKERKWWFITGCIFGWLLTALATTLGAPFWFDLLNKIMIIRSTVKPHQKSPEEASEGPQSPVDPTASQQTAAPPPVTVQANTDLRPARNPMDSMDGCDVRITDVTRDEDLPAAQGGIS